MVQPLLEGEEGNEVFKFSHTSSVTHLLPRALLLLHLDLLLLTYNMQGKKAV